MNFGKFEGAHENILRMVTSEDIAIRIFTKLTAWLISKRSVKYFTLHINDLYRNLYYPGTKSNGVL